MNLSISMSDSIVDPLNGTLFEVIKSLIKNDPNTKQSLLDLLKTKEKTESHNVLKDAKKRGWESPIALQRRRALEGQKSDTSSSTDSFISLVTTAPKVDMQLILKGVIAYVEVKKNNVDCSSGIKLVAKCMGAEIRETFTKDVTHVIFKVSR